MTHKLLCASQPHGSNGESLKDVAGVSTVGTFDPEQAIFSQVCIFFFLKLSLPHRNYFQEPQQVAEVRNSLALFTGSPV